LINVAAKCKTLYTNRFQINRSDGISNTALWLRTWGLAKREANPPHVHRIPVQLEYLRTYAQDSAYIPDKDETETMRAYKSKLYTTICLLLTMEAEPAMQRVMRMWPNTDWSTLWTNIHEAPITQKAKVTWFKVIHDMIPTRARLHTIRLSPTDTCEHCTQQDTLRHRLTECGVTIGNWERTRKLIAITLRTDWGTIYADWLIHPKSNSGPLRDIELYYGCWLCTSCIACSVTENCYEMTTTTSSAEPDGRRTKVLTEINWLATISASYQT
jgi:hypothetical protein